MTGVFPRSVVAREALEAGVVRTQGRVAVGSVLSQFLQPLLLPPQPVAALARGTVASSLWSLHPCLTGDSGTAPVPTARVPSTLTLSLVQNLLERTRLTPTVSWSSRDTVFVPLVTFLAGSSCDPL